jgi:hypothetical protein
MTYRNRYQNRDDMVAQLYLKLRGNAGHNGPDALSFRIFGLDTPWAVGGGRYGPQLFGRDAYVLSQNTPYPYDPSLTNKATSGKSGTLIGTPVGKLDGGGHVVANIITNNLGVFNHTRRFIADYSAASGADAVYVISDSSADGIFWQLCTLETWAITTNGNTFTIAGNNGATLRGTVLYPTNNVSFTTGRRIRGSGFDIYDENNFVLCPSADGDYLVVLTVAGAGKSHPAVSATGSFAGAAPTGTVMVGELGVNITGDAIGYPTPIELWRASYFTTNELATAAVSGDTADPDGDGLSNLAEFALRLHPRQPSLTGRPTTRVQDGYLTITYTRRKYRPDITYTIGSSGDLTNWNSGPGHTAWVGASDNGDGSETVVERDAIPAANAARRFLRLKVTR